MEFPISWTSCGFTWVATLLIILLSYCLRRRKLNIPPGPKPWPIIGNLNLIGPLPHKSLHSLSQKYGPIMQLKFGSFPVLVGSSVEMAEAILKKHDALFSGRPQLLAGKYTTYNYTDMVWSQYGPYWRQARKICLMELFSAKRVESYKYIRVEELNCLLKDIFEVKSKPIIIKDHLSDVSLNIISRMVLGKKYVVKTLGQNEIVTTEEFKKMLDELFMLNAVLDIGDSIPWLAWLDLQGHVKRMKAVAKKFDRFMEHVLDEHNARRKDVKDYEAMDMVDVLLQLADDPNLDVKLERRGIKGFIQDLITGGTDTSSVTLEWAISELLRKPEIFDKATEELDRVIGRERWVDEKDIPDLPYLYAIVKETMRLHPVNPTLLPRLAREDVKIDGYDIAKGTRVLVNVWTIGRDPNIWKNPEDFCPERFIGKDVDVKGCDLQLLPFGAGRRMCPGYNLGLKVIQSSLANLLHGFKWKLPAGIKREELNMEEIVGLTTPRKFPLVVVTEPRLPQHLYASPRSFLGL